MNKRLFLPAAFGLAVAAFIAHCAARGFLEESLRLKAASFSQAMKDHARPPVNPLAVRANGLWRALTGAGIALTALAVISMVAAAVRRETGWYAVLVLVLIFDVGMPMLL